MTTWVAVDMGQPLGATLSVAFASSPTGDMIVGSADFLGDGNPISMSWTSGGGFVNLGNLPPGANTQPGGQASGISADKTKIVGFDSGGAAGGPYSGTFFNSEAYLYTGGVMTGLGFLGSGDASVANGISADGTTIVGSSQVIAGQSLSTPSFPFVYSGGVMSALAMTSLSDIGGQAAAVSANGNVIVGSITNVLSNDIPIIWTAGSPSPIPFVGGATDGHARAVSADGSVVVGDMITGAITQAFIYSGGVTTIIGPPLAQTNGQANGISGNGLVVVGQGFGSPGSPGAAWIWTLAGGFEDLPWLGGNTGDLALGISSNGAVPVGLSHFPTDAVYWVPIVVSTIAFDGLIRKALVSSGSFACGPIPLFPTLPAGFPVKVSPVLDTVVGTTKSLREMRVPQQVFPLWDFELSFQELRDETQNQTIYPPFAGFTQYQQLVQLWLSMYGQTGVFAFDAPWDNSRFLQSIGTGDGTTTSYIIQREWGLTGYVTLAPIGLINQVFDVRIGGVTVAPSTYSVERNRIFFTTPPPIGDEVHMTFSYYYLCRFVEDEQDFEEFAKNRWTVPTLKFQAIYWP